MLLPLLSLLACSPRIPDCEANETYDADGNCIPRDTSLSEAMQAIVDALPACELLPAGDRLDLRNGCADGACAEDSYAQMTAALGAGDCEDDDDDTLIYCLWQEETLAAFIWDEDGDHQPDGSEQNEGLHLYEEWSGTDENGLGMGISLACYVEVFGDTDADEVEVDDQGQVTSIDWPDRSLYVSDLDTDGYVDLVSIFGVY